MAITVLSLGFLSRSDVELACGTNMGLHAQMDYLAESGLEHTKGLILKPHEIAGEYWGGATRQQLVAGSDDYYDVSVTKLGELNYKVNSIAYKEKDGEQVGRSSLEAELRLDPAFALWSDMSTLITAETVIRGDVYVGGAGNLFGTGLILGDVFAAGTITATNIQGQRNEAVVTPPVSDPGLVVSDYKTSYFIGSQEYSVDTLASNSTYVDLTLGPTANNPAGVYFCRGPITFAGNVNINGMLVVIKAINIESGSNVTITAVKNFPALLTDAGLWFVPPGGELQGLTRLNITGLAQANEVNLGNVADTHVEVVGGLVSHGIINTTGCTVNITAAPNKAAIETWDNTGVPVRWSPAGGAFYKSITRR